MALGSVLTIAVLAAGSNAQSTYSSPSSACSSIASTFNYANTTVNFAEHIPAGTNISFSQAGDLATCDRPNQVVSVDLCRIAMLVKTSPISNITLEAWLPTNWTGRFLSTGNGGLSGCIQYEDMAYAAAFGFATVGANNGHNGTRGTAFYHNNEIVKDFVYRSVHTGVVVGKALTQEFYKQNYTKSYYLGCSTGGRQGFKEARDFPEDFDGIVAGAPAIAWNGLNSWSGHFYGITGPPNASTFLTPAEWALVHEDILAQCDGLDGVVDGIIEDPDLCTYRPKNLLCYPNGVGNSSNCLTVPQVSTVRQVFEPYYGVNGTLIYPRMQPGSELEAAYIYYNGIPFQYTTDWFAYALLEDPTYTAANFSIELAAYAIARDPYHISTWKGDLSTYQNKGGKILHYHGQQDPIISSENSPRYYDHVVRTMGLPSEELDEFYRFFRISGMGHCSGGPGAWQIGQTGAGAANVTLDAQHNVLLRMVDWVENGEAPESVTGTKFVNDTASLGVDFVRKHCKYPLRNQCVDPANYRSADAWECVLRGRLSEI